MPKQIREFTIGDKECPFHGKVMYSPHNKLEALSDQLHANVLLLRQFSYLPEGIERKKAIRGTTDQMKTFIQIIEGEP